MILLEQELKKLLKMAELQHLRDEFEYEREFIVEFLYERLDEGKCTYIQGKRFMQKYDEEIDILDRKIKRTINEKACSNMKDLSSTCLTYARKRMEKLVLSLEEGIYQDRWMHVPKYFCEILCCLAIKENSYVEPSSSENWQKIYEKHFSDDEELCDTDPSYKINWIGTWGAYKYAYEKLFRPNIENAPNKPNVFFSKHFLFSGKPKTTKQVNNAHGKSSKDDIKKINNILTFLSKVNI